MSVAVIAEKPSVARDIARVLGARERRGKGALAGSGYTVTWALGHLVRLPEPHEIEPSWKSWRREALPMLPERWPLMVDAQRREQFEAVRTVLLDPATERVVCATDAGREGELIFRYLMEICDCRKPVQRLWISSLTAEAIRGGFARLRDGTELEPLADAARARSRADWLVGMNVSRAATLANDELFSVGRVQTPTLAMLVARDAAIRDFVPQGYLEVHAQFRATPEEGGSYPGVLVDDALRVRRFGLAGEDAKRSAEGPQRKTDVDGSVRHEVERLVGAIIGPPTAAARVARVERRRRSTKPPLLFDLTELQRRANRRYGMSAQRTLRAAQALYERFKLISYPRTDSRHLPSDVESTLPGVVASVRGPYEECLAPETGSLPLPKRFVDDRKVTDHHAIIPTGRGAGEGRLGRDEERVYDLICRRFLAMWQGDERTAVTTVVTEVTPAPDAAGRDWGEDGHWGGGTSPLRFLARGTEVESPGWRRLEPAGGGRRKERPSSASAGGSEKSTPEADGGEERDGGPDGDAVPEAQHPLPSLRQGQEVELLCVEAVEKETQPPKPYTEAMLLTAMESAGKALDDRELSEAMRERGLGTPATRAEIIETLLRREYVERRGRALRTTERGRRLIRRVHPQLCSPALTGEWEAKLRRIERGELRFEVFMNEIESFLRRVVGETLSDASSVASERSQTMARSGGSARRRLPAQGASPPPRVGLRVAPAEDAAMPPSREGQEPQPPSSQEPPEEDLWQGMQETLPTGGAPTAAMGVATAVAGKPLREVLQEVFGFDRFRPFQEQVCSAVLAGEDGLLVMPTGAGKSLCYQLPGLARGGTTLVISPLIALMEDQVAKLQQLGVRAERIHSGIPRAVARETCRAYLEGALDFLFIAPERLGVAGFPEMLAKRTPSLVAVDEAHCISHWGHDFRPDYRLLGERLPALRPAPVLALTATATPRVQEDIVEQLRLRDAHRHIHGFRRENLAIEVVELAPSGRSAAAAEILAAPSAVPAIVYAPTRRATEELAETLGQTLRAAAYHAGMSSTRRDATQQRFQEGELDVVVATIAFGMGIDKADVRTVLHTGLPSSLEGYYQEIGRAGRDGLPARAVLLFSWADRRTHEYFLERDYPDPGVLEALAKRLGEEPQEQEALRQKLRMDEESFGVAVDKLWSFGGARLLPDQRLCAGTRPWRRDYEEQRNHRQRQLEEMLRFASGSECRMQSIVRHFGDTGDGVGACGLCDRCSPAQAQFRSVRAANAEEQAVMETVLEALVQQRNGQGTGALYKRTAEVHGSLQRDEFEDLLLALQSAELLRVEQDSFEKNGEVIHYQRARLTARTRRGGWDLSGVELSVAAVPEAPKGSRRKRGGGRSSGRARSAGSRTTTKRSRAAEPARSADPQLVEALRTFRLEEARRRRIPAFRIFSDRVMLAIAGRVPRNEEELLAVPGVGPALLGRYGKELLDLCRIRSSSQ